ncbi:MULTISPECIES: hypothetical protein [Salinibaculum]|uniref:hypothetical protein n=1 Tax=Salinibaculum TaxID=2732368 RepID=UPI0030D393A0
MTDFLQAGTAMLLVAILGTAAEALRRRDGAAAVNSLVVVAVSLSPFAVEAVSAPSVTVGPELTVWLATAGFLHMVGMLGVYETVWWWDHVTHTVSAALVAALWYAGMAVVASPSGSLLAAATVGFVLAAGVCWELVELVARALGRRFDVEPVLVHYGWRDTAFDLVFDVVGAALVVALDLRLFASLAEQSPDVTAAVLAWSAGVVVAGSLVMAVALTLADAWPAWEG